MASFVCQRETNFRQKHNDSTISLRRHRPLDRPLARGVWPLRAGSRNSHLHHYQGSIRTPNSIKNRTQPSGRSQLDVVSCRESLRLHRACGRSDRVRAFASAVFSTESSPTALHRIDSGRNSPIPWTGRGRSAKADGRFGGRGV